LVRPVQANIQPKSERWAALLTASLVYVQTSRQNYNTRTASICGQRPLASWCSLVLHYDEVLSTAGKTPAFH